MNRWKRAILLAALTGLVVTMAASLAVADEQGADQGGELSADEIIEAALERNTLGFESGRAQVSLLVYDRAGEQRERNLDVRSRRSDERTRTLMTLTDPADVRGQSFLFIENVDGDDDMWMYVPAFDVTRRVEGSQRRSSFLGSHFTFADLESRDLREASYRRLGDEMVGEFPVYVIEARPNNPQNSDYSRVVAYIRQSDNMPMRVRFFNRNGDLDKTLFTERLNTTDDDVTYIEQMTLRSEQGGYTTIRIAALDTSVEIPDSVFDREELGR